jgi:oxygen-independent coproporphyrinogen-3 oxidase
LLGQKMLADAGYAQYEVSAYARDGARCRHNLNYWQFGDYVGIGAGAHGKISLALPQRILRTDKPKQPRDYQERMRRADPGPAAGACIALEDLPFEFMLNALRLNEGFTEPEFRLKTGLDLMSVAPKLIAAQARGLLSRQGQNWRASDLGRRFLNDLQLSFLP